jgi:5-carboxymethyl-2-hydroxymuconate isomerase
MRELSDAAIAALDGHLGAVARRHRLQMTVEVAELNPETYRKLVRGPTT